MLDTNASSGVSLSALYATQGDRFVAELNGLFAGLLIDRARRQALLFNDRYGSERLYSYDKNGVTYFASEAKALLAVLPELRAFDDTGVAQFLAFGSTLGGHTLFRGLKLVPGGSLWRFTPGGSVERNATSNLQSGKRCRTLSAASFESAFADTFDQVLPRVPPFGPGRRPVADRWTGHAHDRGLHAAQRIARRGLHLCGGGQRRAARPAHRAASGRRRAAIRITHCASVPSSSPDSPGTWTARCTSAMDAPVCSGPMN